MKFPPTLDRLMARLVAAIYGIAEALIPAIETIANASDRPWQERTRYAARLWAVIRELLALTARIEPGTLSTNPAFPPARPHAPQPGRTTAMRPKPPQAVYGPATPLSHHQIARRLAHLLEQLLCLAAEAGAALTGAFHRHAANARAIAGCDHLPPTWERAG